MSFPIVTKQSKFALSSGQLAELVVQSHSDRWFIVCTQYGKLGTLLSITAEYSPDEGHGEDQRGEGEDGLISNFDIRVLLGKRDSELDLLFARQIAEVLFACTMPPADTSDGTTHKPNPLLLALALKDPQISDLSLVISEIRKTLTDSV